MPEVEGYTALVQVVVGDGSSSEIRPVRMQDLVSTEGERLGEVAGLRHEPLPLKRTALETFLMTVDWDSFAHKYAPLSLCFERCYMRALCASP